MSNLKKGKRVRLKSTGECGVIRDIERVKQNEGKREDVMFLVKMDRTGWVTCDRKALDLLVPAKLEINTVYPKRHVLQKKIGDRIVTVVGEVDILKNIPISTIDGDTTIIENGKAKRLAIGWAICHPDDKPGDFGVLLALKRTQKRPMAEYYTSYMGEFRDDIVGAILDVKMRYIENNLDKFIG